MRNETDPIEKAVLRRDVILAESGEENRSFITAAVLNGILGVIRLCILIYCLFVACAHILILSKYELNPLQIINIVIELILSIFVLHDALAAGGWRPGVSNSLWLIKFASLIPYHSFAKYYTSIPKNYLRAALLLFVASINNSNDTYTSLQEIRILNIPIIIISLFFISVGYIGAIKRKLASFYVDWIIENYKNYDSKQPIKYETNTWFGWISMIFNIFFFLYAIACYCVVLATTNDSLDLFIIVACIAKCLLCLLIIGYLVINRKIIIEMNWCSIFILLFSLNISINLLYDYKSDIPLNEYCIYVWLALLLIEIIRFMIVIVLYFKSMYRYYTPCKFLCTNVVENIHFWIIKQGFTKIGLILILLSLPFMIITLTYDWYIIDMHYTPFFDYETPLNIKFINIDKYWKIFEEIWMEVEELLDFTEWADINDNVMCGLIISAFAAIGVSSIIPGAAAAAKVYYQIQRVWKILKRIVEMFKKIYDTVKSLVDKIKRIYERIESMIQRVKEFISILNRIKPKYIGTTSVAGLFGFILIPITTVIIILYISFFDRSLRFNSFQISAHSQHWLWLLFTMYLLLLNIGNLLVILSLQKLFTELFVFETVVFEANVLTSDGYDALFAVHLLIIIGLSLFILDRLFIKYCSESRFYMWNKPEQLHSYCKCKPNTPSIQELIGYLIEYHQWNDEGIMTFDNMREDIKYKEGMENENESIIDIMLNVTWSCIKYNKFDENMQITKKEWEYFLTSYKISSFPWTQPATQRNINLQNKLKTIIDEIYSSNDNIMYYKFHQHSKEDAITLNIIGCKLIIAHLRNIDENNIKLISDNDLAIKILLNMSKQQLNHLLSRFDSNIWNLIIAKDVIHDIDINENDNYYSYNNESNKKGLQIKQKDSNSNNNENSNTITGEQLETTKQTQITEVELQTIGNNNNNNNKLPNGWKKIINEEGLVYYHHEKLKKTQWDRPSEEEEKEKKEKEIEEEEHELPSGWEQIQNEEGLIYYHNSILNKTQWEFPTDEILKLENKQSEEDIKEENDNNNDDGELPEFWRAITNNGGMIYYHNEKANKTQWEKPIIKSSKQKKIIMQELIEEKEDEIKENNNMKTMSTQTINKMNGIFERKIIYNMFFQIAFDNLLNKKNVFKNETTERRDNISQEEDEIILIELIDNQWIILNEILIIVMNSDNEDKNYKPTKFRPERVYEIIFNNEDKYSEIIQMGIKEQWIKYLNESLIEYNNKYNPDKLILQLPKRQHFETWFIYIILFLGVSIWSIYSVETYKFMSMKYQPTMDVINQINSLVKAKESMITEWNTTNFDSFTDFYKVSDDQFYDCDIGNIFDLFPSPLKKYNSFKSFMSAMLDGFTVDDIMQIELLDEFDLNLTQLVIDETGIDFNSIDVNNIDINNIDLNNININDIANLNISIDDVKFSFVQFPMVEINTWPSITLWFYTEWYFILLFAPLFSLLLVCSLFIYGLINNYKKKKNKLNNNNNGIEISKQLYAMIIIFAGFCGLEFVISLGSVISVLSTYLPNSIVEIKYENGYYHMILANIVIMLIGGMIFIDIIAGEHIPLLSTIFKKRTTHSNSQTHIQQQSEENDYID